MGHVAERHPAAFHRFAVRLTFDTSVARRHTELAVKARAAGKGGPVPGGYITAIPPGRRGFAVATRDPSAFTVALP